MIDKNMFDRGVVRTVYPAHPITVAAFIVYNFDSLEDANKKNEGSIFNCPAALSSVNIPGAGGDVYMALDFLNRKSKINQEFFAECNTRYLEIRKHDHPHTAKDGMAEAENYWPLLQELVKNKPNFFL